MPMGRDLQQGIGIHTVDLRGRQQVFAFAVSWLAGSVYRSFWGKEASLGHYDIGQDRKEDQKDEGSGGDV